MYPWPLLTKFEATYGTPLYESTVTPAFGLYEDVIIVLVINKLFEVVLSIHLLKLPLILEFLIVTFGLSIKVKTLPGVTDPAEIL